MGGDAPKRSSLGGEATPFRGAVIEGYRSASGRSAPHNNISENLSVRIREWLRPGCNLHQAPRIGGGRGGEDKTKIRSKRKKKGKAMRKAEKKKGETIQVISSGL
jgi:hypothetical protein